MPVVTVRKRAVAALRAHPAAELSTGADSILAGRPYSCEEMTDTSPSLAEQSSCRVGAPLCARQCVMFLTARQAERQGNRACRQPIRRCSLRHDVVELCAYYGGVDSRVARLERCCSVQDVPPHCRVYIGTCLLVDVTKHARARPSAAL